LGGRVRLDACGHGAAAGGGGRIGGGRGRLIGTASRAGGRGIPLPSLRGAVLIAAPRKNGVETPREGETFRATRSEPCPPQAFVVRCACDPGEDGSGGDTVVDHIRLFPIRPDVRWTYRVHEQILPGLRQAGIAVRWSDVVVRHTGYTDPALRGRKLGRDEAILREELEDRPGDPFVLFNLGSIAVEREDWATAIGFLRRSLPGSGPTDSITRKLFSLIARSYQMLGDYNGALGVCAEGLRVDSDDAELLFRKALAHRLRGKPGDAEACWRKIFGLKRVQQFSSVDQGIYGHLTERNLAALAAERGDQRESLTLWPGVLAECPSDQEAGLCVRRIEAPVD